MKKLIFLLIGILMMNNVPAYCAEEINPIAFQPVGGGKYIYCNNPEELCREDLADDGETPEYLMNNPGLGKDTYRLYVTHFNRVEKVISEEAYPGEDIWFDAVFIANEDTEIMLNNAVFEIPENNIEFLNYEAIKTEATWSSLYAEASLRGDKIRGLTSGKVYLPQKFLQKEISLKKGEKLFLSRFIENYSAVPYPKHVLMAADFEIVSGNADLNVFAAKNRIEKDGIPEYPDVNFDTCGFGIYKPGRTHKGIAESLPEMRTEIEYEVTNSVRDGAYIPVTVKNQYIPKGNFVTEWVTNLNPQDDAYSKSLTDESNILKLVYADDSKLSYYGENVPEDEREREWVFDTSRSDAREWREEYGIAAEDYHPNFTLSADSNNHGYACSMGNYGVTLWYDLKIKNSSNTDRVLEYSLSTASDVICEAVDKNKERIGDIVCKERKNEITEECPISIELPAGETSEFSIGITLPVQNYGGLRQAFKICNEKSVAKIEKSKMIKPILVKEENKIGQIPADADEKTKEILSGNEGSLSVTEFDGGYVCCYGAIEGNPYNYGYYWPVLQKVFLLDENFNITKELSTESPVIEMSTYKGRAYLKTIASGSFFVDENGELCPFDSYILPKSGRGGDVWAQDGKLKVSKDDKEFYGVTFDGETPPFVEKAGDIFCFATEKLAGVSADGIYWNYYTGGEITETEKISDGISINGEPLRVFSSPAYVMMNSEYLGFSAPCEKAEDEILIPARFLFEKAGMRVISGEKNVIAFGAAGVFEINPGEKTVLVNGKKEELHTAPKISNGKLLVPSEIAEYFSGFKCSATEDCVKIDGKAGEMPGEAEIGGKFSVTAKYANDEKFVK